MTSQQTAIQQPPASAAPEAPRKITYEEFLESADEDISAEWVDGEVIAMAPASMRHQNLVALVTLLLTHFVDRHRAGAVLLAPFQMKTGEDLPGREPDVIFVGQEHLDRLRDTHLIGPADLAVEIISQESRARDRNDKFHEYEQGGVREYWLIDPIREEAEFYRLGEDGIYRPAAIGDDGVFHSVVLEGLWLKVDWLWQEPRPPLASVLKELGLV